MAFSIQTGTVSNFTASLVTGWYTVEFETPFADGVVPVVFAQTQTRNGGNTPGLRLQNITNSNFQVRMDEVLMSGTTSSTKGDLGKVESDGEHPYAETLGWVAIH